MTNVAETQLNAQQQPARPTYVRLVVPTSRRLLSLVVNVSGPGWCAVKELQSVMCRVEAPPLPAGYKSGQGDGAVSL